MKVNGDIRYALGSLACIGLAVFGAEGTFAGQENTAASMDSYGQKKIAAGSGYNKKEISAVSKAVPPSTRIIIKERRTGNSVVLKVKDRPSGGGVKVVDFTLGNKGKVKEKPKPDSSH